MSHHSLLAARLHALNDQFLTYIQQQHDSNRDQLWLRGVEDYLNYAKALQDDYRALERTTGSAGAESSQPFAESESAKQHTDTSQEEAGRPELQEEIHTASAANIIMQVSASLYFQEAEGDKAWASRGKGLLTLRRPDNADASSKPCHLVFTTESGRVLVNAALYKGLKPQKQTKGRMLLSLPLAQQSGNETVIKQTIVLARLSEALVDPFVHQIISHLPR